ncbi:HlyD family efflux transporter periplasmic adaptor subunit [Hyphomicrobium sp. CS1GBMeth3]|uniref:efflux RND transporter periplasmic adaptor subunit n=1 Tax=Hyphomicrobium sp. CS1GBMeth3 TaxID=1892845 RepID=UPI000930773D|nr:HlyD family efflux transporter periplasmic adaptor subunit [Hyphomicrobium sp. CS1GBMeth3]
MRGAHLAALVLASQMIGLSGNVLRAEVLSAPQSIEVKIEEIDDLKSVYATVRSRDLIDARVRTPGTIATLKVDEGDSVTQGEVLALVGDTKIALRIKALDARIVALESRVETSDAELKRSLTLKERGVASQARVEQAQTTYDVALNELKSARAERSVIETESEEGQVLAPASGRVLKVPVTEGSVVLVGESIATIAAKGYLLRLELPERHARFIKVGDPIRVGARGLGPQDAPLAAGRITQVYPELKGGRVIADAEVPDLGGYFVGERLLTWISAGKRQSFAAPRAYVFKRYGLDYVRLDEGSGKVADVVVQTGRTMRDADGVELIELLAGVEAGDRLVNP